MLSFNVFFFFTSILLLSDTSQRFGAEKPNEGFHHFRSSDSPFQTGMHGMASVQQPGTTDDFVHEAVLLYVFLNTSRHSGSSDTQILINLYDMK